MRSNFLNGMHANSQPSNCRVNCLMVGMHARSKVASERPDMHACMRSCRLFVSSFMQAASGQSPIPSRPFTSHGGSIYIKVFISSGLVGKTNQTLLLVEDPRPVLLRARNH
jgi:hypothetical protein